MTDLATQPAAELLYVDPGTLVVGANVRADAQLDKAFLASVRERGVLEPVVAYRGGDGQLVVLHGQRRTLAAVQAGRDTVPVAVVDQPGEADRLVDQYTENEHRAALTAGERVAAYEQLAALGLAAGTIAKRTAAKRTEVQAGLAVAGSALAKGAVQRWSFMTLDHAAVVAEFDDDAEAVKRLVQASKDGRGFDHLAQRLRDDRTEAAAIARAAQELTATGVKVIDKPPYTGKAKRVEDLLAGKKQLTVDAHVSCPGHAAYVQGEWVATEDGDDPGSFELRTTPVYVCTDYAQHGHRYRYAPTVQAGKTAAGPSEADREAARAERRDVIASNKAWVSAATIRRAWLRSFVARKTAPKGAALFIAESIARCGHALSDALTYGHQFAHELLGLQPTPGYDLKGEAIAGLLPGVSEARAEMLTLALLPGRRRGGAASADPPYRPGPPGARRAAQTGAAGPFRSPREALWA